MKLCMGCMREIEDHVRTCPHCGYDETTLQQESYFLAPGTIIAGKYIVGKVIKYAQYIITYLGMDAEKNRKVMIKEYLPSEFSTRSEGEKEVTIYSGDGQVQFEKGLTTFLNEANQLQHLNRVQGIEQVYDCVAENDTGYVICEYLDGMTLDQILKSGKVYRADEAKGMISQILAGLSKVHLLDIIHCDISPDTIKVTSSGEVKLLDFGTMRYVTTENSKSLAVMLKQGYAAEEQYRSRGVRGPWTDVYSLAGVMYRMITGKVPSEAVDRALMDELKEPSKLGVNIPQSMENALMNALNIYKEERTPSAEAFLNELNNPQTKRKQMKKRKYETGKFPRWAKGLVAGLFVAVLGGGIFLFAQNRANRINESSIGQSEAKVPQMVGLSEEEALNKIEEVAKGKDVQVVMEKRVFNPELETSNQIISQEPAAGETLPDKITYVLSTKERCYYEDIADKNDVHALQTYLGISEDKLKESQAEDSENPKKQYYQLYSIVTKDETVIKPGDLTNEENKQKDLVLADIERIEYYVSPFIKQKMENYVGKNLQDIKMKLYKKDASGKDIPTGDKKVPIHVDQGFFSLSSSYGEQCIVKQNKEEGKVYNSFKNADLDIFYVIGQGKAISWSNSDNPDELKKRIQEKAPNVKIEISGSASSEGATVEKVRVTGNDDIVVNDKVFKDKEGVTVTIVQKPIPTPTPKPTPTPTPQPTTKPQSQSGASNSNSGSSGSHSGSSSQTKPKDDGLPGDMALD